MFFRRKKDLCDPKKVEKILSGQQEAIKKYLELNDDSKRFCTVRNGPCIALDFFSWRKDENHLYISANAAHCTEFFRMPKDCVEEIRGKSDIDLVNSFRERTGKIHSYGELCVGTDDIVQRTLKPGHFIELGYIDTELFILDTYKEPIIENGVFKGTQGYAFNKAKRAKLIEGMIKSGVDNGCLTPLQVVNELIACYQVEDHCDATAFINGFPGEDGGIF